MTPAEAWRRRVRAAVRSAAEYTHAAVHWDVTDDGLVRVEFDSPAYRTIVVSPDRFTDATENVGHDLVCEAGLTLAGRDSNPPPP